MIVVLAVAVVALAYVVYAANGIIAQVEAGEQRDAYDEAIGLTATSLGVRLARLDEPTPTPTATASPTAAPTTTPTPTSTLTSTPTPIPTDTPSPTTRPSVTPIPTNTLRATLIPTNTPRPTITPPPSATFTPSATSTPSITPLPSATFTPSITPTPTYIIEGTYAVPVNTPVVAIPPRAPMVDTDPDVVNFLLLGSDTSGGGAGHTDVMILVSVNKRTETAAMWHLPRDLFVYIPNHTMDRLNMAYALGARAQYPGGGFGLLRETILYNFGIEVDHYARVDFDDFMRVVEQLGGLTVSVDCAIQDWRLITPDLDPQVEENWEYYTLPMGYQTLTPYMALWYVRSRQTTNDLDRGRRQMDALRAMWYQAREQGLFAQATELWPQAAEIVQTDLSLTDVLALAPLAANLDMSRIARYSGSLGVHYVEYTTLDDGRSVLLPNYEAIYPLVADFLTPPTANRLGRQAVSVEVLDATGWGVGFERVAADRLAWEGFAPTTGKVPGVRKEITTVYDYTGQTKGSELDSLLKIMRVGQEQVISQPDPNRTVDYRVEVGGSYYGCVYGNAEDEIEAGPPIPAGEVAQGENVG